MGLVDVLGELRRAEDLELLRRGQGDAQPPYLDLVLDRAEQRAGARLPLAQQPVLAAQMVVGQASGSARISAIWSSPNPSSR